MSSIARADVNEIRRVQASDESISANQAPNADHSKQFAESARTE